MKDFYPYNHNQILGKNGNKVVLRCMAHLCGYVGFNISELPKDWIGKGYDVPGFDYLVIHGGITFAEQTGDYVVYGFDCNHVEDDKNPDLLNPEYVAKLTEQMEQQLQSLGKRWDDFRKADRNGKARIIKEIVNEADIKVGPSFGALLNGIFGAPKWLDEVETKAQP